eukprot:898167_1
MSYVEEIRFKSLTSQLNDSEKRQFILSLFEQDKEILFASLFEHLIHPSHKKKHDTSITNINHLATEIIQQRREKVKNIPVRSPLTVRTLVGCIALYLDHRSYINFGYLNRAVYLGCYDTNQLQQMDLRHHSSSKIFNYSAVDLALYTSVKHLLIELRGLNTFPHVRQGISALHMLQKLSIFGSETLDNNQHNYVYQQRCNWLSESLTANVKNITHLHIEDFDWGFVDGHVGHVMQALLTTFPKLQYLEIHDCRIDVDIAIIKQKLPHLRGLSLKSNTVEQHEINMVGAFGNTLSALSFAGGDVFVPTLSAINFNQLEELNMNFATPGSIHAILKTAKHLRKIKLGLGVQRKYDQIKQTMSKLITSCNVLTHLEYRYTHIQRGDPIDPVLHGIGDGLCDSKQWKRESFMITIHNTRCIETPEVIDRIAKIIQCLETSKIKDWMFVWKGYGNRMIDENEMIRKLEALGTQINVFIDKCKSQSYEEWITVICNQNCKIQGYRQTVFGHAA